MTPEPDDVHHQTHACALSPAAATPPSPRAGEQGAWAWASDELKQKIRAAFRAEARSGEPSPARRFGAGFGAIGLGDKLGLNPHREIENLRTAGEALADRVRALEVRPKRQRRTNRFGSRGVKKDNDYWLDRWERDVGYELKHEGCPRKEMDEKLISRVRSLNSGPAADAINERYRKFNKEKNVVSASSLRRRNPPTTTTNERGETIKVLGSYRCKRWADWEIYRNGQGPENKLTDGSTKMVCHGEDQDVQSPRAQHLPAATEVEQAAKKDCEDNRQRSLFDNSLQTATERDSAAEAIEKGELNVHEHGVGVSHLRPPHDEIERTHDALERQASQLLKSSGVRPSAVHKDAKAPTNRGAS